MRLVVLIGLLTEVFAIPITKPNKPTSCHGIFRYEPPLEGRRRWYGVVSADADTSIPSVALDISLDYETELVGSTFGEVASLGNGEYLIYNPHSKMSKLPLEIRFYVQYGEGCDVPIVREIRLNGQNICFIEEKESSQEKPIEDLNWQQENINLPLISNKKSSKWRENEQKIISPIQEIKAQSNHKYSAGSKRGSKRGPLNYDAETIRNENYFQSKIQPLTAKYETLYLEIVTPALEDDNGDDMESAASDIVATAVMANESVDKSNVSKSDKLITEFPSELKIEGSNEAAKTKLPALVTNKTDPQENIGIIPIQDKLLTNKSTINDTSFIKTSDIPNVTLTQLNISDSDNTTAQNKIKDNNELNQSNQLDDENSNKNSTKSTTEISNVSTESSTENILPINSTIKMIENSTSPVDIVSSTASIPKANETVLTTIAGNSITTESNIVTTTTPTSSYNVITTTITPENIKNNTDGVEKNTIQKTIYPIGNATSNTPNNNEKSDASITPVPVNASKLKLDDIDADINKLKGQIEALIGLLKLDHNQSKSFNFTSDSDVLNDLTKDANKTIENKSKSNKTSETLNEIKNVSLKEPIMEKLSLNSTPVSNQNYSTEPVTEISTKENIKTNENLTISSNTNISVGNNNDNITKINNITNISKQSVDENSNNIIQDRFGIAEITTSLVPTNESETIIKKIAAIVKEQLSNIKKTTSNDDANNENSRITFLNNERTNALKSSADIISNSVMVELFNVDTIAKEVKFINELASFYEKNANKKLGIDPEAIEVKPLVEQSQTTLKPNIIQEDLQTSTQSATTLSSNTESGKTKVLMESRTAAKIHLKHPKNFPRYETLNIQVKTVSADAESKNMNLNKKVQNGEILPQKKIINSEENEESLINSIDWRFTNESVNKPLATNVDTGDLFNALPNNQNKINKKPEVLEKILDDDNVSKIDNQDNNFDNEEVHSNEEDEEQAIFSTKKPEEILHNKPIEKDNDEEEDSVYEDDDDIEEEPVILNSDSLKTKEENIDVSVSRADEDKEEPLNSNDDSESYESDNDALNSDNSDYNQPVPYLPKHESFLQLVQRSENAPSTPKKNKNVLEQPNTKTSFKIIPHNNAANINMTDKNLQSLSDLFWSSLDDIQNNVTDTSPGNLENIKPISSNKLAPLSHTLNIIENRRGVGRNQPQISIKTVTSSSSKHSKTPSHYETLGLEVKTVLPNNTYMEKSLLEDVSVPNILRITSAFDVGENTEHDFNKRKFYVDNNPRHQYISSKVEDTIPSITNIELHLGPDIEVNSEDKSKNSVRSRHTSIYKTMDVKVNTVSPFDLFNKSTKENSQSKENTSKEKDTSADLDLNKLRVDVQNLDSELKHYIAPKVDENQLKRVENMVDKYFGVGNLKNSLNFDMPGAVVVHKCHDKKCRKTTKIRRIHRHRTITRD